MRKDDFDLEHFNTVMKAVISILVALILIIVLISMVAKVAWVLFRIALPLLVVATIGAWIWKYIENR